MAATLAELKRSQEQNVVKGTVNAEGNYPRKEIDHFIRDVDTCNLFLLALRELQDQKYEQDPWSWFGVASIHGIPYQSWQNIDQQTAIDAGQFPAAPGDPRFMPGNQAGNAEEGYCSHTSVLFPTWHRPYMAMMEQTIFLKIADIASRYKRTADRQRYQAAAKIFRLPYFDPMVARVLLEPQGTQPLLWRCGAPQILSSDTVRVKKPTSPDMWSNIPNPLYSYKFAESKKGVPKYRFDGALPFKWTGLWAPQMRPLHVPRPGMVTPNMRTVRTPDEDSGVSDHRRLQRQWEPTMANAGVNLYALFAQANTTTYRQFSQKLFAKEVRTNVNPRDAATNAIRDRTIEAFHDTGHAWLGAAESNTGVTGHMVLPRYASYDPVFWLHHCNIDRIYAIWQMLNPAESNSPFSQDLNISSYTEPTGYTQSETSPLMPFLRAAKPNKRFWTSVDCRDTTVLGYTYAEQGLSVADLNADIGRKYLWVTNAAHLRRPQPRIQTSHPVDFGENNEYAPCLPPRVFIDGGTGFPKPYIRDTFVVPALRSINPDLSGVSPESRRTVDAPGADTNDLVEATSFAAMINTNSIREWDVLVRYEKYGAGTGFYVHFFIGKIDPNVKKWTTQRNYAGQVFNWANPADSGCVNCDRQAEAGAMVADVLPLTSKLQTFLSSPTLLQPISLKTLGTEDVVPFLAKNLQWRIIDSGGQIREPSEVAQFKVVVMSRVFHPPPSPEVFGTWEEYDEPEIEITHGKPGGLSHNEV